MITKKNPHKCPRTHATRPGKATTPRVAAPLSATAKTRRQAARATFLYKSPAPAVYPACDALNPLRRYEQKILALVARIERRPAVSAVEPFTYEEARAIYKYHGLRAFFPVAGFADRLNNIAAPSAMMARDLSDVFRRPFPRPSASSLKEAARVQRENERHRRANLIQSHKGRTTK